jgi:solute carrier family 6 GABA transporter-like protein 1
VKYVSGPILAIVYSFSYPNFINSGSPLSGRQNPLHIMGWFDVFIPPNRRNEGHIPYAPMVTQDPDEMNQGVESGLGETETDAEVTTKQASPDSRSLTDDAKGDPPVYATSAKRS